MSLWESVRVHFEEAGVQYGYLFGSRSRGTHRHDSDTDIGVWYPAELDVLERFHINCRLQQQLESVLKTPVDLVILNDAKPILQHQAVCLGQPIFQSETLESRLKFESLIRGRYEDYAYSQRFFTSARKAQRNTA